MKTQLKPPALPPPPPPPPINDLLFSKELGVKSTIKTVSKNTFDVLSLGISDRLWSVRRHMRE